MLDNLNKKYLAEAKKLAKIIAKNYKPEKIILYGSVARGKARKDSDIDFCIIKKTRLPMRNRVLNVYKSIREWDYVYAFEPIIFTPFEMKQKTEADDYFLKEILKGKVIYQNE